MHDDYPALMERARALATPGRRAILGITGYPGSGKTTLAESLTRDLATMPPTGAKAGDWVTHVPMDGFHLADIELSRLGRLSRKGAPDTFDALGYEALLRRLHENIDHVLYAPAFDREVEQPIAGSIAISPDTGLVITEGNYLLLDGDWAGVRDSLDEVWFCDLPETERENRLVTRHERYGKSHQVAVDWVRRIDMQNARAISQTRCDARVIVDMSRICTRPWAPGGASMSIG